MCKQPHYILYYPAVQLSLLSILTQYVQSLLAVQCLTVRARLRKGLIHIEYHEQSVFKCKALRVYLVWIS